MTHIAKPIKTPAELLPVFYAEHDLGLDGGKSRGIVKINITKWMHFYIPNFEARRNAVLWHDIHHLVTGYSAATFLGECEISAWEIASGCKNYWAAFLIDTSGVLLGCFISPRKILQAYARGRKTINLYHNVIPSPMAINMSVAELRKTLFLDTFPKEMPVRISDIIAMGFFLIFAAIYSILSIVFIPLLIVFNIWIFFRSPQGPNYDR